MSYSMEQGVLSLHVETQKRKHVCHTIEKKVDILSRLENGESGSALAKFYNVGKSTITDIKNKKQSILNYVSKLESEEASKRKKTVRFSKGKSLVEEAVYTWFLQKHILGEPITGPMLCEKALELNNKLGGPSEFKASIGWLRNFKVRHGIREVESENSKSPLKRILVKDEESGKLQIEGPVKEEDIQHYKECSELGDNLICTNIDYSLVQVSCEPEIVRRDVGNICDNYETDGNKTQEFDHGPTHSEAFRALEVALQWYEKQLECSLENTLLLRGLRDLAADKMSSVTKVETEKFTSPWKVLVKNEEAGIGKDVENVQKKDIQDFTVCAEVNDNLTWQCSDRDDSRVHILCEPEIVRTGVENMSENSEDPASEIDELDRGPTHLEAYRALHIALQWFRRQPENSRETILLLRRLKDLAANKISSNL